MPWTSPNAGHTSSPAPDPSVVSPCAPGNGAVAGLALPRSPFSSRGTSRLGFARLKLQLALAVAGAGLSCPPCAG